MRARPDVELPAELRRSLEHLREAMVPNAAELDASRRIALGVLERLPVAIPGPRADAMRPRGETGGSSARWALRSKGVAWGGAGLLAVASAFALGRASTGVPPEGETAIAPTDDSASSTEHEQETRGPSHREALEPLEVRELAWSTVGDPEASPAEPAPNPTTPLPSQSTAEGTAEPAVTSSRNSSSRAVGGLGERELLRRADAANRNGNPDAALALVGRVKRSKRTAESIDFVRLVALCKKQQDTSLLRERFLQRFGESPYETRLRQDCPAGRSDR